jgi:Spy/CpxP family protein refolding chaperone
MKRPGWRAGVLGLALVAAGTLRAQNPPPAGVPSDSGAMAAPDAAQRPGMMGGARAERLRAQIEERFAQRVKAQLGLNDEQMAKLRVAVRADRDRRLQVRDREQDLRRALAEQMRPGVAADQDSVARLLDALAANHVTRDRLEQQEQEELSQFLTPVQRTQLLFMRQQLQQRIQTILQGRWRAPAGRQGPMGAPPRGGRPGPGPF